MKINDINDDKIYVGVLSTEQKDLLSGVEFRPLNYYSPFLWNDIWVISIEEISATTEPNFLWIKDVDVIEYTPIVE